MPFIPSSSSIKSRSQSIPLAALFHSLSKLLEKMAANGDGDVNGMKKAATPAEEEHHQKALGWAARDSSGILSPFTFSRRYLFLTNFCKIFRKFGSIQVFSLIMLELATNCITTF